LKCSAYCAVRYHITWEMKRREERREVESVEERGERK
jgi:hypothetical protein